MQAEVKKRQQQEMIAVEQKKQRINENERLKNFSLEILDGDQYRTITLEEFSKFAKEHPELAKYFLNPTEELPKLKVPEVDQSARIYHHWEKACNRMLTSLQQGPDAWIFKEPVDEKKLGITDYFTIIKSPMDFGTMREKLKRHEYRCIEDFIKDIQLVFNNCFRYNGQESRVGEMARNVRNDFRSKFIELNFKFYITDPDFEDECIVE